MLNEATNKNDTTRTVNNQLDKVPNSNDTTYVANNVCLTTMNAQKFSMVAIQPSCRKGNLPETRDNGMITRKVCEDGNILCSEKEWRLYVQ